VWKTTDVAAGEPREGIKKGGNYRPDRPQAKKRLTQASLVSNQIVDRITLIRAQFLNGCAMFQAAHKQGNQKYSRKKSRKGPSFHQWPSFSVNANKAFRLPQLKEHNPVPGLPFHLVEKYALYQEPLFTGKHLELISTFHAPIS
jgi:hypothetical protein